MSRYFVIDTNDDGETYLQVYNSKEALLEMLAEISEDNGYPGKPVFIRSIAAGDSMRMDELESNRLLIIKGEVVAPFPKKVVQSFDVE